MFRNKQSSDWLASSGINFLRYIYLPLGIKRRAAVIFSVSGYFWGHTDPNVSAKRVPGHDRGGCGGRNLKGPTGGAAYGTPRKI